MRTPGHVKHNALPTVLTRPAVCFHIVFITQFCSHVEIREIRKLYMPGKGWVPNQNNQDN